jgi:hypothetical protein
MNSYTKPNVHLHISLHDARITEVTVHPATSDKADGAIVFVFGEGVTTVDSPEPNQTGKASVKFSGIDFDFSHVYAFKDGVRQEKSFEDLAKIIESHSVEIVDESYGYNYTHLAGCLYFEEGWQEIEIVIYHFGETVYEWEDAKS